MTTSTLARVVVIGTSCSGKTTLARALAERLAQPHIEMDAIHWQPNWTPLPHDELRERVAAAVATPRWVLDGTTVSCETSSGRARPTSSG